MQNSSSPKLLATILGDAGGFSGLARSWIIDLGHWVIIRPRNGHFARMALCIVDYGLNGLTRRRPRAESQSA